MFPFLAFLIPPAWRPNQEAPQEAPKDIDQARKVLLEAIRLLKKRGHWHSGGALGPRGEVCLFAAVRLASGDRMNGEAWKRLQKVVGAHPIGWNDRPDRTIDQVIAKLKKAAYST